MVNSISTNIIRDQKKELDFITTPNTKEIFERIFNSKFSSNRSFNLIGNYGTGKSTFLWACENNLKGGSNFFSTEDTQILESNYEFIKILGEEESLMKLFARELKLKGKINSKKVLIQLENFLAAYNTVEHTSLVIFIDEFGKVLEYASKNRQSSDLYFLQQLAEWVNDEKHPVYLVNTLHQNFLSYGSKISDLEKIEWEKVKGRFIDLVFNEPVEQLLFFASNKLKPYPLPDDKLLSYQQSLELIQNSKLVSFNKIMNTDLIKALYPLDWLSSNILVKSLQKYGQNERSLFSFLNDKSKHSISLKSDEFYAVSDVYDYLVNTLPTEINSSGNSHRAQWLTTFRALERAELFFENDYEEAAAVIKTISLVNLFTKLGGLFDDKFLIQYFKTTKSFEIENTLKKLLKSGIIRFYGHSNKINFLEGTDIDIEQELINVGREINTNIDFASELKNLVDLSVLYVKRYSFEKGTKRFFEFKVIDKSDEVSNSNQTIDGYINLVFENFKNDEIKDLSKSYNDNLFVVLKNSEELKESIIKIIKYKKLIEKHQEDHNALKLLNDELLHLIEKVKAISEFNVYDPANDWFYNGLKIIINSKDELLIFLTRVCHQIYSETPTFDNELINKNVISPPINAAKKYLLSRLLENESKENLGYDLKRFPPDKAIYISLIKNSGLHLKSKDAAHYYFSPPKKDSRFSNLWDICDKFLQSTISSKRSITELYEILQQPPFKLKNGFIDFWIPLYLIIKKEDYALFYTDDKFVPFLSSDTLDLIHRKPGDFFLKSYNVSGLNINILESYKELVGVHSTKSTQSTFLSIYSNFLRFIKGLNSYSTQTKKLTQTTIDFREAILSSKDPESALFDTIPTALGFGKISLSNNIELLKSYSDHVRIAINELRNVYAELLDRIEATIIDSFGCKTSTFQAYQSEIRTLLKSVDKNELINKQKVFYTRLNSSLDDRNSWLKSIADAALEKKIEAIIDEEENVLISRIKDLSEGLIMSSKLQEFNANSNKGKLYLFKFYTPTGEIKEEKRLLKNNGKNYSKISSEVSNVLDKLKHEERKDLLFELFSKEFIANE